MIFSTNFIEPCYQYAINKGIKLYSDYDVLECRIQVLLEKGGLVTRLYFDYSNTEEMVVSKIMEACDMLDNASQLKTKG